MLRDALVSLIKARCKRTADTGLDASIVTEMQFIQDQVLEKGPGAVGGQVFSFLPWFLLSDLTDLAVATGDTSVAVPTDFISECEEAVPRLINSTDGVKIRLTKTTYEILQNRFDPESTEYIGVANAGSSPGAYALQGETFYFLPEVPDDGDTYTVRLMYYAKQDTLDTNIENQWTKWAADVLVAEVGQVIAGRYLRDEGLKAEFAADLVTAWARLKLLDEDRRNVNTNPVMLYE